MKKTFVAVMMLSGLLFGGTPVFAGLTAVEATVSTERLQLIQKLLTQLVLLQQQLQELQAAELTKQPIRTEGVYTLGSPTAPIQIVTYTDLDCPFCKMFHDTVHALVAENSNVAMSYRHMPLTMLHPNAEKLAVAAECVGREKGSAGFWTFIDALFASRDINEKTDLSKLTQFASKAGMSATALTACTKAGAAAAQVAADVEQGAALGVRGTPVSFIYKKGQKVAEIEGAQPLDAVRQQIKELQ